jgi:hypothetical protein
VTRSARIPDKGDVAAGTIGQTKNFVTFGTRASSKVSTSGTARNATEAGAPSSAKIRRPRRPAQLPEGCWPRRMRAELAAGYVGEQTVAAFVRRVRHGEYPAPVVNCGRRRLWLKDDLDRAIGPMGALAVSDVAGDL